MTQPGRPAAVLFDWGGTLTGAHDGDLRAEWVAFAQGYGTMACATNELAGRLLVAADDVWARSRTAPTHGSGTLAQVLGAVGLDPASGDTATEAGLAAYWDHWLPRTMTHPGAEALLVALRGMGLRTGLLSNTIWPAEKHREWLARDGVLSLLDATVFSCDLPVAKPHPEAFRAAAAAVGCAAEDCVYVGDRLYQDVLGAQGAGMRAVLIDRGRADHLGDAGPGFLPAGVETPEPDARVRDLTDVADVVAAWLEA